VFKLKFVLGTFGPKTLNKLESLISVIADENRSIVREQDFDSDIRETYNFLPTNKRYSAVMV